MVSLIDTSYAPRSISRAVNSATRDGATGALERAAEAGREIRAHRQLHRPRLVAHLLRLCERLVNRLVDVALAEGFGRRREDRHFVHARLAGARQPLQVRHERGVADAGPPRDAGEDVGRVGHLRHPFRADEGRHLDHRVAGLGEPVHERDLVGRRNERRLVLQAVAGADFDDPRRATGRVLIRDPRAARPAARARPACTRPILTRPSRGAVIGSSIFIASSMISTSPRATVWPGATLTRRDRRRHRRGQRHVVVSAPATSAAIPGAGGRDEVDAAVEEHPSRGRRARSPGECAARSPSDTR